MAAKGNSSFIFISRQRLTSSFAKRARLHADMEVERPLVKKSKARCYSISEYDMPFFCLIYCLELQSMLEVDGAPCNKAIYECLFTKWLDCIHRPHCPTDALAA
jgi:hypothetical protein